MDSRLPGRVAAGVVGVRGQVEQLVLAPEHDLDLLHGAAVAEEMVVHAAADQPRAQLGERPVEGRAFTDDRAAVLEGDGRGRQLLERRHLELRIAAQGHLQRPGQQRLTGAGDDRAGRDELLEQRDLGSVADPDQRPRDQRPIGCPDGPANDDRPLQAETVGNLQANALAPEATGQRGQLLIGREAGASLDLGAKPVRIALEGLAECLQDDARGDGRGFQDKACDAVLAQLDQAGDAVGQRGRGDRVRGARP